MKRKRNELKYVRDKKKGKLKWSIYFFHLFNFALRAENDLLIFVSHVGFFQMHTLLYAKLFRSEDVLNRGI